MENQPHPSEYYTHLEQKEKEKNSWENISFGIFKPDCLKNQLVSNAIEIIERGGLEIIAFRRLRLEQEDVDLVYSYVHDKPFYQELMHFMTSGDVYVYIAFGQDAVNKLNSITGFTDPSQAAEGTLRSLGSDVRENVAHSASDSSEVKKSTLHFFDKNTVTGLGLELEVDNSEIE